MAGEILLYTVVEIDNGDCRNTLPKRRWHCCSNKDYAIGLCRRLREEGSYGLNHYHYMIEVRDFFGKFIRYLDF